MVKNVVVISLLLIIVFSPAIGWTATRAEMYRKFGPILIEAVVRVIKDEINILRAQHGLPERTNQQLLNALDTKLASLTLYDWMVVDPNNP